MISGIFPRAYRHFCPSLPDIFVPAPNVTREIFVRQGTVRNSVNRKKNLHPNKVIPYFARKSVIWVMNTMTDAMKAEPTSTRDGRVYPLLCE